jgi:hypothetical protein
MKHRSWRHYFCSCPEAAQMLQPDVGRPFFQRWEDGRSNLSTSGNGPRPNPVGRWSQASSSGRRSVTMSNEGLHDTHEIPARTMPLRPEDQRARQHGFDEQDFERRGHSGSVAVLGPR